MQMDGRRRRRRERPIEADGIGAVLGHWPCCPLMRRRSKWPHFVINEFHMFFMTILLIMLRPSRAQNSDFYDPSNSYFWTGSISAAGGGGGYGSASDSSNSNPFTPQDFGGSSSDGFDVFERQQQQRQLAFEVNGGGPSFLPRPSSSFPSDFHAYGSAGAASQTGAAGDDQLLDDDDGEAGGFAAVPDHTKFPTLIPPQKLATVGLTEPAILVEDVTEPSQQQWAAEIEGTGRMGMASGPMDGAVIKDVSMMRSVPAPMGPGQMQMAGAPPNAWMGPSNLLGPANDCFGSSTLPGGACPDGGGGSSYLSRDGASYQFPMPDDGQMMANGGAMPMGGGGGGMPPLFGGFDGRQLPIAQGVNGLFPSFPSSTFGTQRASAGGQLMASGGMFGPGGGFGAGGGDGEGEEEEEEEQDEFGSNLGSFLENGPPPTSLDLMGAGSGMSFGMGGMAAAGGGQVMAGAGGADGMGEEEQRYAEYLELINRKYGIGMPGANPGPTGNAAGLGQIPMGGTFLGNSAPQQPAAGFSFPPWGISPTTGGLPNGQGIGQGLQGMFGQLGQAGQQQQQQQQMCLQSLQQNGGQAQQKLPLECRNGGAGGAGGGGGQRPMSTGDGRQQQQQQVEAVAAALLAGASEHAHGQAGLAGARPGAGSIAGSVHGGEARQSSAHSSPGARIKGETHSEGGSSTSSQGETGKDGEAAEGQGQEGRDSVYGSAMLGRLIGDSLASSLRQQSGLIAPPSSPPSSSSFSSYALSGARVPFPFGTGKQPHQQGVGVDGGAWLPPAPSVSSLLSKMPPHGANANSAGSLAPDEPDSHHHQQQQQRSIEAIQRQLLLALLSSTTSSSTTASQTAPGTSPAPPTPMPTTSSAATTAEQGGPVQQSTTSLQALTQQIRRLPAVLYADSRLTSSRKLETLLREVYGLPLVTFFVDRIEQPSEVERNLEQLTAHQGLPFLFICGTFIGSTEHIQNYHEQRQVPKLVEFVCNGEADGKGTGRGQDGRHLLPSRQQMDEPPPKSPEEKKKRRSMTSKGRNRKKKARKNGQTIRKGRRQAQKVVREEAAKMVQHEEEPSKAVGGRKAGDGHIRRAQLSPRGRRKSRHKR